MKGFWLGLVAVALAGAANAEWTYDKSSKTLTNDTWKFTVTLANEIELTITGVALQSSLPETPDYAVDFKNEAISDNTRSDYKVVGIKCENAFRYNCCTKFLGPDVKTFNGWKQVFYNNTKLTEVELHEDIDNLGVSAFYGATNLETIKPTHFKKLTTLPQWTFGYCSKLVGDFVFDEVAAIGAGAFRECKNVRSVFASKATTIGERAFSKCAALVSLGDEAEFTSIDLAAFENCTSLTSFPDTPKLTSIGQKAFTGCTALTEFASSSSSLSSIGPSCFTGCANLERFWVPNSGDAIQTVSYNAFYCLGKLKDFAPMTLPNVSTWGTIVFGTTSSYMPITGDFKIGFTTDMTLPEGALRGLTNLTSITFLTSVTNMALAALGDHRPGMEIHFAGEKALQGLSNKSLDFIDNGKWSRIFIDNPKALPGWQSLIGEFDASFQTFKTTRADDYPGGRTIGILPYGYSNGWLTGKYLWVIDNTPPHGTVLTVM